MRGTNWAENSRQRLLVVVLAGMALVAIIFGIPMLTTHSNVPGPAMTTAATTATPTTTAWSPPSGTRPYEAMVIQTTNEKTPPRLVTWGAEENQWQFDDANIGVSTPAMKHGVLTVTLTMNGPGLKAVSVADCNNYGEQCIEGTITGPPDGSTYTVSGRGMTFIVYFIYEDEDTGKRAPGNPRLIDNRMLASLAGSPEN